MSSRKQIHLTSLIVIGLVLVACESTPLEARYKPAGKSASFFNWPQAPVADSRH